MIGGVGIGRGSVTMAKRREVRLEDEAVPELNLSDGEGGQDERELVVAGICSLGSHVRSEQEIRGCRHDPPSGMAT
jgi:hypothetical protein